MFVALTLVNKLYNRCYKSVYNAILTKYLNESCSSALFPTPIIALPHIFEDAHFADSRGPMSFKNQVADSFYVCSVCIMDYFSNQMSLFQGEFTKTKNTK